jgi:hypothetical protein
MLEIDHIHNNGCEERRADRGNHFLVYQRIRDGNVNLNDYQLLCRNCNASKRRNGCTCEHKTEQRVDRFARFKARFDFAPFGLA